jgi:DNA-binding MarR family transcriptional regulator
MASKPALQDPDTLLEGLVAVGEMIEQRLDAALQPERLSVPKLAVLYNLMRVHEPVALGILSQRLGCVRSNITQLIDRLEADNLVRRVPDPDDRRSVRAAITDQGRDRFEAGMRAVEEAHRDILSAFSPSDREQLARLLARFRKDAGQ